MSDWGLRVGTPTVDSVGPITFGPDGILFVADSLGARVVAVQVTDGDEGAAGPLDLDGLETRLAGFLGCDRDDVIIRDMAVHPTTDNVYLSVSRGKGSDATPLILRIRHCDGSINEVDLANVAFAEVAIPNAPSPEAEMRGRKLRTSTITDLAYIDGELLVAGMSNEEFSSTLRRIPFPFRDADGREIASRGLEIFHVSHGAWETAAPIRTFAPYGDDGILASYTCTPLVRFTRNALDTVDRVVGTTVAELGAMNSPVDIVTVDHGDSTYVLVSNTRHPLMKIAAAAIDAQTPLTQPRTPTGAPFEALPHKGVSKMARMNGNYVLFMQKEGDADNNLRTYETATL